MTAKGVKNAASDKHRHGEHVHEEACTDPSHHVHNRKDYIHAVENACDQRGLRLTPIRAQVLELIAAAGKPIKAYDLLDQMKGKVGASAPPTVYRALDFLLENGFIHRLSSVNAFVSCHHPQVKHTVPFLICDCCHIAIELEDEAVPALLEQHAHRLGFKPRAQSLEVHGICAQCAAK